MCLEQPLSKYHSESLAIGHTYKAKSIRERLRQFKLDLTSKWALAHDKEGEDDKVYEKYEINKEKWT